MLAFLFTFCLSTFRPDHAVSLSVVAPWYEVPLFEQLLFYIADYSISSASTFLQEILKSTDYIENSSYLWEIAESSVPPNAFPLMKAQIDNGFFLPRAEMYRETARQIGGSSYTDLFVTGCDNLTFKPDYSYPATLSSHYMHDILFGPNQTKCYIYANLHNSTVAKILLSMIQSEQSFVLRPTSKTSKFGINLRGFGIEMRPFKYSMEYGVKDSIILDTQKKQNGTIQDETIGKFDEIPPSYVDPSRLESIGIKLSSYLQSQKEPMPKVLRDITNNFPLYLPKICSSPETPESIGSFNRINQITLPEDSFSLINGRHIPLKNLDIFSLLDIITQEKNFRTILESHFRMDFPLIKSISSATLVEPGSYIIDYRSNMVNYLNNIEKDAEYSSWSTSINDVFDIFTGMPLVKKNLINAIYLGNIMTIEGSRAFLTLTFFVQQQLPLRVGLVPYFNLADKLSRKVCYAFHHLAIYSQKAAIKFIQESITSVTNSKDDNKMPTEDDYAYYYTKYSEILNRRSTNNHLLSWNNLHNLYDQISSESLRIRETHEYLKKLGFKTDVILINGRQIKRESIISQDFLYEIQKSIQNVQQVIYQKGYRALPRADIIDILSEYSTVIPSLDVRVLDEVPIGLGLIHQSLSHQLDFAEYLNDIEWNWRDKGIIVSFFILFCPEGSNTTTFERFMKEVNHSVPTAFAINPPFPETIMKIDRSKATLLSNGRIYVDFEMNEINRFVMVDIWNKNCVYNSIKPHVSTIKYKRSEAILYLSCIFTDWLAESVNREPIPGEIFNIRTNLIYRSFNNNDGLHWDIVVDPFTREFQRMSDIIYYIDKLKVIDLRLVIIPPADINDQSQLTTLSTYYRNSLSNNNCVFTYLNDTTTYSCMPDMPNSFIFESMKASVDLDNILLKELSPGIHEGVYILTNIMTEGVCYTSKGGEFAEGAELALIDKFNNNERKSDTIVMMSNGYWQLPANPGRFSIELGGKRSKMVYEMIENEIIVSSFASFQRSLLVRVNKGMEGLKVYNMTVTDTSNTTRVDVFSVASGHLYERLLKIMMLAVRRRSNYNVKFWIIKTFLSPQFKATLPIMSKKFNFSYSLVSYKWPTWLRPQYEKQRIIWGNKILFLDVIFPLDLERVIYVDSDQIVRTDLIELMRMDFGEAPYAFTPFCNSRKETEPFRFWKSGYWKDLLGDKKYHISALFAIDLRRFRQMAAGDWLRYHYQKLSADPGSLANLDQDLPNYAQIHIPIYSLPQNWLWCETWCSDDTMKFAKTIDLCNNPLTKKPKLFVAQTMVKEWPGLDEEVRNISAGPDDYQKFFFNNTI